MSLNVENLFVKCQEQATVLRLVETHWSQPSQPSQGDWGLPSSFEPLLAKEPNRKLAVSPPQDGWIALIESKEVIDFAFASLLSEKLNTHVLAIQVAEATGAAGYALAVGGQVLESYFNDDDDNPLATVQHVLKEYKVPFETTLFREASQKTSEGWNVKHKA